MSSGDWVKGKLLVALPTVRGDTFFRTVLLVLAHGPMGALGVVLNRPTGFALDTLFPDLAFDAADPRVLFTGGPVQPDGIICLARGLSGDAQPGFERVLDQWGMINPRQPPRGGVDNVRVYLGYAQWVPRQLEFELARHSWLVVDALPDDLTTDEPEDLWVNVVDRQGPRYARIKHVPRDPSLN